MQTPSGEASLEPPGWRFLIDENMPRPLAPALRNAGYGVEDTRDVGLRGHPDVDVWTYAQTHGQTIITHGKGFGDIRLYPKPHAGIIVGDRIDHLSPAMQVRLILDALTRLADQSLADLLIIIAPGQMRLHP